MHIFKQCSAVLYVLFFFLFIFNWTVIALQCCIGFWCTTREPAVYIPSLSHLPPASPIPSSRSSQSTKLSPLYYIVALHQPSVLHMVVYLCWGFPGGSVVKNPPAGDADLIPESGRSPPEGNGNPLQYSCLGNPMERGAWWAIVCGLQKSQTQLSDWAHSICMSMLFSQFILGRNRDADIEKGLVDTAGEGEGVAGFKTLSLWCHPVCLQLHECGP